MYTDALSYQPPGHVLDQEPTCVDETFVIVN